MTSKPFFSNLLIFTVSVFIISGQMINKKHPVNSEVIKAQELKSIAIDKKHLLGQFNYKTDNGFVEVDAKYGNKKGMYLQKEVYEAFLKMKVAAAKDGITLIIVSATRNFNEQKMIWEAKWSGKKLVNSQNIYLTIKDPVERAKTILNYSSMPGTSRHHWGTDIDLNSIDNSFFNTEKGIKLYNWLSNNAATYGFCQPYTKKDIFRPNGYEEEKWHWSYLPIAKQYLTVYKNTITYSDITGFLGAETASKIDIIKNYIFGINQDCNIP
ncbi:MAG: hypothetical protein AUJ97_07130 [Bacteroidetes bacterium CG2_30_32_10]|nr:MAG: hypothetical protein AUJ97_07130 [Bacteroidetes bacterium CG2_30_32_10]